VVHSVWGYFIRKFIQFYFNLDMVFSVIAPAAGGQLLAPGTGVTSIGSQTDSSLIHTNVSLITAVSRMRPDELGDIVPAERWIAPSCWPRPVKLESLMRLRLPSKR